MRKIIQFSKIILLILFGYNSYSQVTVKIQSLQYQNSVTPSTTVADCGNIDFGTSTSTTINFGINLSKSSTLTVGISNIKVFTKRTSSDFQSEKQNTIVQVNSWTGGNPSTFSTTGSITLYSSDFNTSGGILYVSFFDASSNETKSCSFTITKTELPSFSFSPASLLLACGDTSARTFSVTPANIPSGATVTYQWSYGGWSGTVNSSMRSVLLTPNSLTALVSNVSVTPYINGVAQATKNCIVSIAPFTANASINTGSICNVGDSKTYAINDCHLAVL
jgi:hypothetical protein